MFFSIFVWQLTQSIGTLNTTFINEDVFLATTENGITIIKIAISDKAILFVFIFLFFIWFDNY
jgi:hypothetical protein